MFLKGVSGFTTKSLISSLFVHGFSPNKNGVLRKLKHIFPNTYQRINSICSPAKVGLVVTDFNYQPGS